MRAKTSILLVLMFVLAIGAGVVAGKLASRVNTVPQVERTVTISDELHLSDAQKKQMRQIWEGVQSTATDCSAQAKKIQYDYEEAVTRLLDKDQLARYQKLTEQSKTQIEALEEKRRGAFKAAVDRTRQMLSEPQRKIYDKIIHDRIGALGSRAGDANE